MSACGRSSWWFVVANVLGVVVGSWLAAESMNAVVSAKLAADAAEARQWRELPQERVIPALKTYLDPIVARNVFANGAQHPEYEKIVSCGFERPTMRELAIGRLLQDMRIVLYFEGGQPQGFKLYGSVLSKIGLMNGDVVRRVNGHAVPTPHDALRVYALLKSESNISIEITRHGRPLTVSLTLP